MTVSAGNSIQRAIDAADAGDTICLEAGHYRETLTVDRSLVLVGAGGAEGGTIIEAAANAGVEDAGRVVLITGADVEVVIRGVVIRHGVGEVGGGVLVAQARVRIEDSTITENVSTAWGGGIGFEGGGTLELVRSTVSENTSDSDGAGIDVYDSDVVSIIESTISGNTSGNDNGGGIWLGDDGTVLRVERSTISGNVGGGIRWSVFEETPGLTIVNSTLSGNVNGPGLNFTGGPDGIGSLTVLNSTITGNSEPVAWVPTAHVVNTVVTDGCGTALASSGGHNVEPGTDTCGFHGAGDRAGSGVDADLGPLAANGGPTLTHAPGDGSAVVGAGATATCAAAPVAGEDQRGRPRRSDFCSVGSVDVECTFIADGTATAGGTRGTVSGCRLADFAEAARVWITVDGQLVAYVPGAPAWVNAGVAPEQLIPRGTTVVVDW